MKHGDFRLLNEAPQRVAYRMLGEGCFGLCFRVPEHGWASSTQRVEQDQDDRRPEVIGKRRRPASLDGSVGSSTLNNIVFPHLRRTSATGRMQIGARNKGLYYEDTGSTANALLALLMSAPSPKKGVK